MHEWKLIAYMLIAVLLFTLAIVLLSLKVAVGAICLIGTRSVLQEIFKIKE